MDLDEKEETTYLTILLQGGWRKAVRGWLIAAARWLVCQVQGMGCVVMLIGFGTLE